MAASQSATQQPLPDINKLIEALLINRPSTVSYYGAMWQTVATMERMSQSDEDVTISEAIERIGECQISSDDMKYMTNTSLASVAQSEQQLFTTLDNCVDKSFSDGVISWDRIAAMLLLLSDIMAESQNNQIKGRMAPLVRWCEELFDRKPVHTTQQPPMSITEWIGNDGGWSSLLTYAASQQPPQPPIEESQQLPAAYTPFEMSGSHAHSGQTASTGSSPPSIGSAAAESPADSAHSTASGGQSPSETQRADPPAQAPSGPVTYTVISATITTQADAPGPQPAPPAVKQVPQAKGGKQPAPAAKQVPQAKGGKKSAPISDQQSLEKKSKSSSSQQAQQQQQQQAGPSSQPAQVAQAQQPSASKSASGTTSDCCSCGRKISGLPQQTMAKCPSCGHTWCLIQGCKGVYADAKDCIKHQQIIHRIPDPPARDLRIFVFNTDSGITCNCSGVAVTVYGNSDTLAECRLCKKMWCLVANCGRDFPKIEQCFTHRHQHSDSEKATPTTKSLSICSRCGTPRPHLAASAKKLLCEVCGNHLCYFAGCTYENYAAGTWSSHKGKQHKGQ